MVEFHQERITLKWLRGWFWCICGNAPTSLAPSWAPELARPSARDAMYRGRVLGAEIIEVCVRWYMTYRLSSRDLVAMMVEESDPRRRCAESLRDAAPAAGQTRVEGCGCTPQQVTQ